MVDTGGVTMVGSWIGRWLVGLPALLGAVGAGAVVVGWLGEIAPGVATTSLLAGITILRASRTGIVIDVDRGVVEVHGFWRNHTVAIDDVRRVDVSGSLDAGPPGLRLQIADGHEIGSLMLAYVGDDVADEVVSQLRTAAHGPIEVSLDPSTLRPSVS